MSRTYVGRIFSCRSCKGNHLIPYETINDESKQQVSVRIECPTTHIEDTYTRENFKVWHGFYWTYLNNVVKPLSVEKVRRKK